MAKTPRMTISLTKEEQNTLAIYIKRMNLNSSGQLLRILISGDEQGIQWIADQFKKPLGMFDN